MRSSLAVATAVALLANATLAHAADAGYCVWQVDPQLSQLTEVVDDARCVSDQAVVINPHLVAMVQLTPMFDGPREVGKPSGVRTDVKFSWLPAPITDPDDPGQVVFAMNQYQSYKDLKAKHDAWSKRVAVVGERAGEVVAARTFMIGPTWMRSGTAAWVQAGVQVSGDLVFQAPFVVAAPFTGFASLLPMTAMYAEALYDSPVATGRGASEFVDGVKTGDFDRAVEGAAEFCGGVGIALTAAAPMMEAGNALAPRTSPISPFRGRTIPKIAPRAVVSDGKFGYLFGRAGGNEHNIARTLGNKLELERAGIYESKGGREFLQRHFDETVSDPTNVVSTYSNEYGTYQVKESFLAGPTGFLKIESTWEVLPNGDLRMTTAIPFGGSH